jgi:hypothetical protein
MVSQQLWTWEQYKTEFLRDNFNLYPTNAPRPFNAASYEHTKKFKCPIHSRRGLEL